MAMILSLVERVGPCATKNHSIAIFEICFLRNPSVALNFSFSSQSQWSIWPILVEWPLDELELRNKKENVARNDRRRMVLGFKGSAQLLTPGQVKKFAKMTKIVNFILEAVVQNP